MGRRAQGARCRPALAAALLAVLVVAAYAAPDQRRGSSERVTKSISYSGNAEPEPHSPTRRGAATAAAGATPEHQQPWPLWGRVQSTYETLSRGITSLMWRRRALSAGHAPHHRKVKAPAVVSTLASDASNSEERECQPAAACTKLQPGCSRRPPPTAATPTAPSAATAMRRRAAASAPLASGARRASS